MSTSVTHNTFTIERNYDASLARVFAAWADPQVKARWFAGPDEFTRSQYQQDFRVGGTEISRGGAPGGPVYTFQAEYRDIVPDQRIIWVYEMYLDDVRMSVSLATVELSEVRNGTRLVLTEQGAYLDGLDSPAQREEGTAVLLDALGAELVRQSALT